MMNVAHHMIKQEKTGHPHKSDGYIEIGDFHH